MRDDDPLTEQIKCFTLRVVEARAVYRLIVEEENGMDRLTEKLKQAAGVVGRTAADIEQQADFLIAREDEVKSHARKRFEPHHHILDRQHTGLDQLEDQLKLLSNQDPLHESGDGSKDESGTGVSQHEADGKSSADAGQ